MAKKSFEFDTRYSDVERDLEERKSRIKTICFKTCSKCGETKLISRFTTDRRNLDGHLGICKECRNRYYSERYHLYRDKVLMRNKKYRNTHKREIRIYFRNYQEEHKELFKDSAREYYLKNREAIIEKVKKYNQGHREAVAVRKKRYREKNRDKIKEYKRKYRLSKKL